MRGNRSDRELLYGKGYFKDLFDLLLFFCFFWRLI